MSNNKKYWKGLEELNNSPSFQKVKSEEFNEYLPAEDFLGDKEVLESSDTSRRDFLKYLGFGVTAASLAACEAPVNKVIPYVVKGDKTNPGVANYFATNYFDGFDYCDIVVKTREGRPIKIEGNKKSPLTNGAINARVNSSVLSLYDEKRYRAPQMGGESTSWSKFNRTIKKRLSDAIVAGGKVRILTNTITSPSTKKLVSEFVAANPSADIKHVSYDAVSASGMLEANKESFGVAALPTYDLSKAKSIVSIGADFMNSFPSSLELTSQYAKGRKPENGWMSKHFQFEASLSLSGTNADVRMPMKPSEYGKTVVAIYNYLNGNKSGAAPKVKMAAEHLLSNKGESIVLCGSNDKNIQNVVVAINQMLGNYGKTINIDKPSFQRQGMDADVAGLVKELKGGSVDVLIIDGANPVYNLPADMDFKGAMSKAKTSIVFATRPNETSVEAKMVGAAAHYLESWNDENAVAGHYSLTQPSISPLFDTKQLQDCLMYWMGLDGNYYDYIKATWSAVTFPMQSQSLLFEDFWNTTLEDGFFSLNTTESRNATFTDNSASGVSAIAKIKSSELEIEFYSKVGIGSGNQSHNPWLQELPDPVSKITWDNYIAMNPVEARAKGFATEYGEQKDADTINITVNGVVYENVPVVGQPGQAPGTVSVAVGYGQVVGKSNEVIGFNAYSAMKGMKNYSTDVSMEAAGGKYQIATTQTHQTVMGRTSIVRETTLDVFQKGVKDNYNPAHMLATHEGPMNINDVDLWAAHPVATAGHHWGMSIDLNSCIGCGSCVTSCNSENNVPVVGKDEVRRSREMHWIRIDRYFSSTPDSLETRSYGEMEQPEDNPQVVHQPMMCQHCNHAPCETVCPVAATTHSNEGINQMTYNRCIGTRYCANNCPYKVRRFNWFNYMGYDKFADLNPSQDDLGRMVLNPDVTVRARGVMEKCSLCIQKIQTGKLDAKKESRPVMDGDIETACSSACPTNAITFGDYNDKTSRVLAASQSTRAYRVIEEVGTQSNVYYQTKVRNVEPNIA
jgi:MoCo/4Fe-4S cofactor protein with predicted Tat translocation signal